MTSTSRKVTGYRLGMFALVPVAAMFLGSAASAAMPPDRTVGIASTSYTFAGVADWDRDGHQDIITRQDTTGDLWLYPGQSLRGPGNVQRVQIGNGW
jgi:hypothetical protein